MISLIGTFLVRFIMLKINYLVGIDMLPPSTKIQTGRNAADATSNQPKISCFEAWSSTKPAEYADQVECRG